MFTGIIEEKGRIRELKLAPSTAGITLEAEKVIEDARPGDSIAVNGICLTVTSVLPHGFTADVMPETLRRSSLSECRVMDYVNLERALRADGRLGGHIVSGHIDGTGTIKSVRKEGNALWYTVSCSSKVLETVVEKGSVALDGISLTVAQVMQDCFCVSVIPHTAEQTTLAGKKPGSIVNIETDLVGKYVQKLLGSGSSGKGLSLAQLEEEGY